jgi:hypothetical protein
VGDNWRVSISVLLRLFFRLKGGNGSPTLTGMQSLAKPVDNLKRDIRRIKLIRTGILFAVFHIFGCI